MKKMLMILFLVTVLVIAGCGQSGGGADSGSGSGQTSGSSGGSGSSSGATGGGQAPEEKPAIDFPTKAITWVLPFNPGGTSDASARVIANVVPKYLPKNVEIVIDHKAGGNATLGPDFVNKAAPDGYTIGTTISAPMTLLSMLGETSYTKDDFKPIIKYLDSQRFLIVPKDSPWKTFEDWIAYVKENPGKFTLGDAGGALNPPNLAIRALMDQVGGEVTFIPYNGGGPAVTALLGGHVDGIISSPANLDPNDINILFTLSSERSKLNPDVPTLIELGYDIAANDFYGLLAPKDTPDEIVQILHDAFKQALEDPETIAQMENLGLEISYLDQNGLKQLLDDEYKRVEALLPYVEQAK